MIKNVIFDFDGVLVDSIEGLWSIHNEILEPFSRADFSDLFMGNTLSSGRSRYKKEKLDKFFAKTTELFSQSAMMPDAKKFVTQLHSRDMSLFIVTSNTCEYVSMCLVNSGITKKIFTKILDKDQHYCKTKKIHDIHEEFSLNIAETVFITDSLGDIIEGNKAGVCTIGVTFGVHSRAILESGLSHRIFDSWRDVYDFLKFK